MITEKEAILSHSLYIHNLNCTYCKEWEVQETGILKSFGQVILNEDLTKCSIPWKVNKFLI